MAVTYRILFDIKPGQKDRVLALLTPVLDAMRHEETFLDAALYAAPEAENRLMLVETWADHQEVLDVQIHRPYRAAYHAALADLLAAPREIEIWQPLRADRK
jgi:quinol monooxygenase YgiN